MGGLPVYAKDRKISFSVGFLSGNAVGERSPLRRRKRGEEDPKENRITQAKRRKTTVFAKAKNNFLHFANILDNQQKKWLNNYKVVILRSMRNFY